MKWLTSPPRWFLVSFALPILVLNCWVGLLLLNYFQAIVTKLVIAMLLSFVLSYPVDLLQRLKIHRVRAVFLVLLTTVAVLIIMGFTLIPILIEQVNELSTRLPTWVDSGSQQLQILQTWMKLHHLPINLSQFIQQLEEQLSLQIQSFSGQILNFLLDTIGSLLNIVLTIVLTFYLLLHGERLWDGIFQWFPPQVGFQIRKILRQNFQNYFIGQATMALLMGTAMTIAFVSIQLPFGLLFGWGVGVLALFPFGAPLGIAVVSLLAALKSIWLGLKVLTLATFIDQLLENVVAPQLMGGLTGLNPVWILLSLLAGVKVGGMLGLVVAVPIASSLKNMIDPLHPSVDRNSAITAGASR